MGKFDTLTSRINVYDVYGECFAAGAKSDHFELYASSDMGLSKVGSDIKAYKTQYSAADYTPFLYKGKSEKHHL